MNKKFAIIGMILLLFGVFIPVSVANNLPPFGSDQEVYTYTVDEEELRLPPTIVVVESSYTAPVIKTHKPIPNYQMYGLTLKDVSWDHTNVIKVLLIILFVGLMATGVILLISGIVNIRYS